MADPITAVALASTIAGGATSAAGSIMGGNSQATMYQYQAGIAAQNAQIAKQNASYAIASGEVNAQQSGMKTRFQVGQIVTQQGAGGLAVGSGSNARVVSGQQEVGVQDQALIRANSAKQAYGYEVTAAQDTAQSQVDTQAASNAKTTGYIQAAGSLLGSAGSVSSKWLQASQSGAFGSSGSSGSDPYLA